MKKANFNQTGMAMLFISLLVLSLYTTIGYTANVEVSVDRNPVSINESFNLVFSSTQSPDDDPDFSPLEENFKILNQQKSSQTSWVNGSFSKIISWRLDVIAVNTGELQIPAISFGDDVTAPLTISVLNTKEQLNTPNADEIFLQVETSPEAVYVQSQIIYTVQLFQRVAMAQASLTEPNGDDLVIEKLSEDSQYNTQINGVNYRVTKRQYAIFPQKSGVLEINPLELTAQVIVDQPRSQYGSFFNTQQTRTKRVLSKSVQLKVLPALASFKGQHWLAAKQLHLEQSWSNDELTIKEGEPLTRTLTLLVNGVTASQLPEFTMLGVSPELKLYPDQAVLKNKKTADGVVAFKEQKIALLASKPGQYHLPDIVIPWFNTTTSQLETAKIPAVTINVLGKSVTTAKQIRPDSLLIKDEPSAVQHIELPTSQTAVTSHDYWKWLAIVMLVVWVASLLYIVKARLNKKIIDNSIDTHPLKLKKVIKALQQACTDNNPQAARQALVDWGEVQYNSRDMSTISSLSSLDIQEQIKKLNQYLYAKDSGGDNRWDGQALLRLIKGQSMRQSNKKKPNGGLESLYKI